MYVQQRGFFPFFVIRPARRFPKKNIWQVKTKFEVFPIYGSVNYVMLNT